MSTLKSGSLIRCPCGRRYGLCCNSPNVRRRWKDKGKQLTWMTEELLMVIAVSRSAAPSVTCCFGGADSWGCWRDGLRGSLYVFIVGWSAEILHPPHPSPYSRWSTGVEQLNNQGLLTHSLSTAQYTISLCSWPDQATSLSAVPLWNNNNNNWDKTIIGAYFREKFDSGAK